jgi:glycosyltransferase involved in cell wall biosynthesis
MLSNRQRHLRGVTRIRMSSGREVAFLLYPYHRGGITRWSVDAAREWTEEDAGSAWVLAPRPVHPFLNRGASPTILSLVQLAGVAGTAVREASVPVGWEFEFGTLAYRAEVYRRLVHKALPPGVPILLPDDEAVWLACTQLVHRHPIVAVMHSDVPESYRSIQVYGSMLSACVFVSRRIRDTTHRLADLHGLPCAVIPCGVRRQELAPTEASGGVIRLLWVGRFSKEKRVSDLLSVASVLKGQGVRLVLTVAGTPPGSELPREAEAHGLGSAVRFFPWLTQREVANLYRSSDIFLLTSAYEGFPVVLGEALAAGCGVVSTRVSGIEDLECHHLAKDAVRLFPVGDVEAGARAVMALLRVPTAQRVRAARSLAESELSMAVCIRRYREFFSTALPQWRPLPTHSRRPSLALLGSLPVAAQRYVRSTLVRNARGY